MSIISDALKKVELSRSGDFGSRSDTTTFIPRKRRASFFRHLSGAVLLVGLIAVLGVTGYVVLVKSAAIAGQLLAAETRSSMNSQAVGERGLGRYSLEDKAFHDVGAFSAGPGDPLFVLNGIARNEDGFMAVINDQILRKGDRVEGAVIVDINMERVELRLNEERIFLEKSY